MTIATMVSQLNAAIGAHGAWKLRLTTALQLGRSDENAAEVRRDDLCAFGRWLHGPEISERLKAEMPYQVVRRLHAEFHQSAAQVLLRLKAGDLSGAREQFEGDYQRRSERLVAALTKWKRELLAQVTLT